MIYYPTVMARYSLFVLKVPLNPKQTTQQSGKWLCGIIPVTCPLAKCYECAAEADVAASCYLCVSELIAAETLGALSTSASQLLNSISSRISSNEGETREMMSLFWYQQMLMLHNASSCMTIC